MEVQVIKAPEVGQRETFFCESYGYGNGGKFWAAVRTSDKTFTVEWGAMGASKSRKSHSCATTEACVKKINNLIKSKLKKGYTSFC
jgi:predicted DNA-binding WGR domain protein